jgi:hypothetical protein
MTVKLPATVRPREDYPAALLAGAWGSNRLHIADLSEPGFPRPLCGVRLWHIDFVSPDALAAARPVCRECRREHGRVNP